MDYPSVFNNDYNHSFRALDMPMPEPAEVLAKVRALITDLRGMHGVITPFPPEPQHSRKTACFWLAHDASLLHSHPEATREVRQHLSAFLSLLVEAAWFMNHEVPEMEYRGREWQGRRHREDTVLRALTGCYDALRRAFQNPCSAMLGWGPESTVVEWHWYKDVPVFEDETLHATGAEAYEAQKAAEADKERNTAPLA